MADVIVETVEYYQACCGDCGWEGEMEEFERDAMQEGKLHAEKCPVEPKEPEETYQEQLDRLVEVVRNNTK